MNVVLDFSQEDFVINEFAGSVDICMDLTNLPAEGLECDLVIPLNLLDGKASERDFECIHMIIQETFMYFICNV